MIYPQDLLVAHTIKLRLQKGLEVRPREVYVASQKGILINTDIQGALVAPKTSVTNYFYKNIDDGTCHQS